MLVPKKKGSIPANELFQEQPVALDQSTLFETPVEQDTLFTPAPVNTGEGLSRFHSGFNSFARRAGKSILSEFPKSIALLQTESSQASILPPKLQQHITEQNLFWRFGEWMGEAIDEVFPENQEFQDEMMARVIPAALGDITGTTLAALSSKGRSLVGPSVSAGIVGASTISSQEYEQALEKTGDADVAMDAFLLNLPVGATEAIPIGRLFRRVDNLTGGGVKRILAQSFTGGIEELLQESLQTSLTNLVATQTYDENRRIFDGLGEAAQAGGTVGFLLNAVGLSTRRLISGTSNVGDAQEAHNVNEEVRDEARGDVEDYAEADIRDNEVHFSVDADFGFMDPDAEFTTEGEEFGIVPQDNFPPPGDTQGNQQFDEEAPFRQTFDVNPDDELNNFQRFFQRWLTPRGLLPEETFEAIKRGDALRRAEVFESEKRVANLYTEIREHMPEVRFQHGRPQLTPQQEASMNHILRGGDTRGDGMLTIPQDIDAAELPETVVRALRGMRLHIDRMSNSLLEDGIVGGPLAERVAANIGTYIHRSYRAITDGPKWARAVPVEVRNRAEAFIRQRFLDTEGRNPSPREVNNVIDSLLYNQDAQRSLLLDTQFGGVDLTLLRTRTAVPAPIRALLGEVDSPIANYLNTSGRLARLVNDQRTLTHVVDLGMGQIFFREGDFFRPSGYNQTIDSLGDPALNPLHGLQTHPDILNSLKEAYGQTRPLGRLHQAYLKLNGLAKLSKTVLSPITHARNTLGGSMFLIANGHNPLAIREPKAVLTTLLGRSSQALQRQQRYIQLDLMDQSIAGNELDAVYREMRLENGIPLMENFEFFRSGKAGDLYNATVGRGIDATIKLYQAEDNLIRLSMFEKELGRYRTALDPNGDWNADEVRALEEQVASMIRNTYPNYARVPDAIRRLRRNVLVGPFVSFPYEVIRTTMNTARLARGESQSSNPAIRRIGIRRALGLTSAIAAPLGVALASAAGAGITGEIEDDIERMSPHWDQNTPKYYISRGDGKVRYINLGYITPYSVLTDPVQAMLFGHEDTVHERFIEGLSKFSRSFLGVELTTQAIDEIRRNEKANGTWVTNPANPQSTKFADYFTHMWDTFEPGIITSTVTKPLERGPAFKAEEEALAMLTGFRITELDVGRSMTFKARDFNRDRRNARAIASRAIRDPNASLNEKITAASVANEVYEGQWRQMQRLYESALRLGMTPSEVDAVLDAAGIGKKVRQDFALNRFTPLDIDINAQP